MNTIITSKTKHSTEQGDIVSMQFAKRIIYLVGVVDAMQALEISAQLDYLNSKSDEDITMIINSPGGSVTDGLSIIDAMNRSRCKIKVIVTGMAASMAAVIAACGTKGMRYITPNAIVMIHQPLGGFSGQASDMEIQAREILRLKALINKMMSEKTGKTVKKIEADCDRDYYLNAENAIKYGIIDKIAE